MAVPKYYASDLLTMPAAARTVAVVAAVALLFVVIMQYGFGYRPCILCQWQRLPYAVALIATLMALIRKPYDKKTAFLLAFGAIAFAAGAVLAGFHTGVERHWWRGTSGCAASPLGGSIDDLRAQLLHTDIARCDVIGWSFLGLSMTNWNLLLSLLLTAFASLAARRQWQAGGVK